MYSYTTEIPQGGVAYRFHPFEKTESRVDNCTPEHRARSISVRLLIYSYTTLHVEYKEREKEYGILFIFSLFCEYMHLESIRVHVIHRDSQAEYVIHILVVAPHEYVNIYFLTRSYTTEIPQRGGGAYQFHPLQKTKSGIDVAAQGTEIYIHTPSYI